jgi:predicted DNA-binding protein with PD1-like motif
MIVISVKPGQEVMETVTQELEGQGIANGAIVSLVGAIDRCCISNMPKQDAKSDILTQYEQPFEMSGTGEIKDGKPHIHCILGREGDNALAGHLHWARVDNWFVNVYVMES